MRVLFLACLLLSSAVSAQDIYKCKSPDGTSVFSSVPCDEDSLNGYIRNRESEKKAAEERARKDQEILERRANLEKERRASQLRNIAAEENEFPDYDVEKYCTYSLKSIKISSTGGREVSPQLYKACVAREENNRDHLYLDWLGVARSVKAECKGNENALVDYKPPSYTSLALCVNSKS